MTEKEVLFISLRHKSGGKRDTFFSLEESIHLLSKFLKDKDYTEFAIYRDKK